MHVAPLIDEQKAGVLLSATGGIWPRKRKIIRTELVTLPLYVFTARLSIPGKAEFTEMISVDAIKGEFAFYSEPEYADTETENLPGPGSEISEEEARKIAVTEYQRMLHKKNLRTRNHVTLDGLSNSRLVFYPYWIGYYRRKNGYDFEVIDAVGGGRQGIRMRPVFIDLILQMPAQGGKAEK
jgi:hypothetical protein